VTSQTPDGEVAAVAARLGATEDQVREVEALYGPALVPLDAPSGGARGGEAPSVLETLADDAEPVDERLAREGERQARLRSLKLAMTALDPRERAILSSRRLREAPETLEALSARHGVSKERIRQLEGRALEKLKHLMRSPAARLPELLAA
jgi:RNA polymerase sigma-32 factor